jgi:hypothetical protein
VRPSNARSAPSCRDTDRVRPVSWSAHANSGDPTLTPGLPPRSAIPTRAPASRRRRLVRTNAKRPDRRIDDQGVRVGSDHRTMAEPDQGGVVYLNQAVLIPAPAPPLRHPQSLLQQ